MHKARCSSYKIFSSVQTNPRPEFNRDGLTDILTSVLLDSKSKTKEGRKRTFVDSLFHLKECACLDSCFDRTKNSRRFNIETLIIQHAKKQFHKPSLNYLSLGAGFLLQDFVICAYLLLNGYSLCVRLIEPKCAQEEFTQAYQQFCCLQRYAESMQLQFKSEYFPRIDNYWKNYPEEQIDIAQAIDFDAYHFYEDAKMDLQFSYQKLGEKGFLYFSIVDTDFIFQPSSYKCIAGVSYLSQGEKFFKASKNVTSTEKEITHAMGDVPLHIPKHILGYIGLFSLKAPVESKPVMASSSIFQGCSLM